MTVVIPTGPPKAYAIPYMVASLRELDYPDFEVVFAWTKRPDYKENAERAYLVNHLNAMPTKFRWQIIDVPVTQTELAEPYTVIVRMRQAIRSWFLDHGGDYMFMVGGDNPPTRTSITRLLKLGVDCALGVSYQRPGVDKALNGVYPMMWKPIYRLDEVWGKNPDLEPINREQIRRAFYRAQFLEPIYVDEDWEKRTRIDSVVGGDGNCLYSRRVLEAMGWSKPNDYYVSEDIQFLNMALMLGFTTACDPKYHVPHLHDEGGAV